MTEDLVRNRRNLVDAISGEPDQTHKNLEDIVLRAIEMGVQEFKVAIIDGNLFHQVCT